MISLKDMVVYCTKRLIHVYSVVLCFNNLAITLFMCVKTHFLMIYFDSSLYFCHDTFAVKTLWRGL